jgi:dinuclear metal center YbgI/SA1388 family protein
VSASYILSRILNFTLKINVSYSFYEAKGHLLNSYITHKEDKFMKVHEIAALIENAAPSELAYPWDNVGILCGDKDKEVKKALVTLDVNENTVNEAVSEKCDMIISHHPIFLNGVKRIDYSTSEGRMIKTLIKNDIAVFAAHTNMDTAENGINSALAELFSLQNIKIIEKNGENTGLGRYGELIKSVTLKEFAKTVKTYLNTPFVRVSGNLDNIVKTVAVASGSCSDIIPEALKKGCDVIITADMKYHNTIENVESGIAVIDAGHYPTEIIVMDIFEEILKDTGIKTIKSKNKDIFNFI